MSTFDEVGATIVAVARRTGQLVSTIAAQSYALTLYTAWHLHDAERRERIDRASERFDLAGLIASAFHQPQELTTMHQRFVQRLHGVTPPTAAEAATRYARFVAHMRDQAFQPLPIGRR